MLVRLPMSHNATITTFGYPDRLVAEYTSWVVIVHPKQMTLGALIVACTEDVTSLGTVSPIAWSQFAQVSADVEDTLSRLFAPEKLNYLALMMVDPHVHFHVVPRYADTRTFGAREFTDAGWPALPPMTATHDLVPGEFTSLGTALRAAWPVRAEVHIPS